MWSQTLKHTLYFLMIYITTLTLCVCVGRTGMSTLVLLVVVPMLKALSPTGTTIKAGSLARSFPLLSGQSQAVI